MCIRDREQVSGEIRAVIGAELRPGNIWENIELPRLMENLNAFSYTHLDVYKRQGGGQAKGSNGRKNKKAEKESEVRTAAPGEKRAGGEMAQMDARALEAAEEVFDHGVVIGIALAGHALPCLLYTSIWLEGSTGGNSREF